MTRHHDGSADLGVLTALGFGPDSALMNEPKLFVDRGFLAELLADLEEELGREGATTALFQIGLMHGLRDAYRIVCSDFLNPDLPTGESAAEATPLAIRFGARVDDRPLGAIQIPGVWPECYEAEARLSKLGSSHGPACALSCGYTSGWLSGTFDADLLVVEESCAARGDGQCRFVAREVEAWREDRDARAVELLRSVPFEAFRDLTARDAQGLGLPDLEPAATFDPDAPVVHVWGPVMVLPFQNVDEALHTVDTLGRDAGSSTVRVVIIDLRNSILDEGFGAAALEQSLEAIESWGAEAILTSVSPFCEDVVTGIESSHLLIRKDLPEAIATAFQIVEAQRHTA